MDPVSSANPHKVTACQGKAGQGRAREGKGEGPEKGKGRAGEEKEEGRAHPHFFVEAQPGVVEDEVAIMEASAQPKPQQVPLLPEFHHAMLAVTHSAGWGHMPERLRPPRGSGPPKEGTARCLPL